MFVLFVERSLGVLVIIYAGKMLLLLTVKRKLIATALFLLLTVLTITYIYEHLSEWNYEDEYVRPIVHWVGEPIMVLFLPSLSFYYDTFVQTSHQMRRLLPRYIGEIALFYPWSIIWAYIMLMLGWIIL